MMGEFSGVCIRLGGLDDVFSFRGSLQLLVKFANLAIAYHKNICRKCKNYHQIFYVFKRKYIIVLTKRLFAANFYINKPLFF